MFLNASSPPTCQLTSTSPLPSLEEAHYTFHLHSHNSLFIVLQLFKLTNHSPFDYIPSLHCSIVSTHYIYVYSTQSIKYKLHCIKTCKKWGFILPCCPKPNPSRVPHSTTYIVVTTITTSHKLQTPITCQHHLCICNLLEVGL
jgi:hypothetical protein